MSHVALADPEHGTFTLRPVDPDADAELLHGWVTDEKAGFWGLADADVAAVRQEYARIDAKVGHEAFVGLRDGEPAFLLERYDPRVDPVGATYEVREGDVGMHVLVAPTDHPVHGFTHAVMRAAMAAVLADPAVRRVVVEPDLDNEAIQRLNADVGFVAEGRVELPDKTALLSFSTREQHEEAVA